MKLSDVGEISLLKRVRERFTLSSRDVLVGIGDDTAVVKPFSRKLLLTTDMMVQDVHFDFSWTTPFQVGYKLISSNVSDIYAMGGEPDYVLLDLAVPADTTVKRINEFFSGIERALATYRASLIGGDVSVSDKMVVAATLVGHADKAVRRSGARLGDRIYVTGSLGDAACGLELSRRINRPVAIESGKRVPFPLSWSIVEPLLRRHLLAEVKKPGAIKKVATAMMDISDGLLIDLSRLCTESGVGALLYEERIPVSKELNIAADYLGKSSMEMALSGGEDYEILFTAPPGKKVRGICIGEIVRNGLKIRNRSGRVQKLTARGYQHFTV